MYYVISMMCFLVVSSALALDPKKLDRPGEVAFHLSFDLGIPQGMLFFKRDGTPKEQFFVARTTASRMARPVRLSSQLFRQLLTEIHHVTSRARPDVFRVNVNGKACAEPVRLVEMTPTTRKARMLCFERLGKSEQAKLRATYLHLRNLTY